MKVLIAAGGTGGHLYPGIALAHEFRRRRAGVGVLFVVTGRGLEPKVLEREGFSYRTLRAEGLVGRGPLRALKALLVLAAGFKDAYGILRAFDPDLVIGIGGYASGPVLLLAGRSKARCVLLEPNAVPGWTNRLLTRLGRVDLVAVAFEETRGQFGGGAGEVLVLGSPVRAELAAEPPPLPAGSPTLLVLGGSQGARSINRAVVDALPSLKQDIAQLFLVHQTGPRDVEWVRRGYEAQGVKARVEPFLYDLPRVYPQAHLVLSRSGAMTVAEITACGRPSVLVPFPHATHGHQMANARVLARAGAAVILEDKDLSGPALSRTVAGLLGDRGRLEDMARSSRALGRPRAAAEIVSRGMALAEKE